MHGCGEETRDVSASCTCGDKFFLLSARKYKACCVPLLVDVIDSPSNQYALGLRAGGSNVACCGFHHSGSINRQIEQRVSVMLYVGKILYTSA